MEIRWVSGERLWCGQVEAQTTMQQLKISLEPETGIPPQFLVLVSGNAVLQDADTLQTAGLCEDGIDATVEAVMDAQSIQDALGSVHLALQGNRREPYRVRRAKLPRAVEEFLGALRVAKDVSILNQPVCECTGTLLHLAAREGDLLLCQALLDHPGFELVDALGELGGYPRFCFLHPFGVLSHQLGRRWGTALHSAVFADRREVCQLLLRHPRFAGAVSTRCTDGSTALHLAVRVANSEICADILQHAPLSVDEIDDKGRRALDVAAQLRWQCRHSRWQWHCSDRGRWHAWSDPEWIEDGRHDVEYTEEELDKIVCLLGGDSHMCDNEDMSIEDYVTMEDHYGTDEDWEPEEWHALCAQSFSMQLGMPALQQEPECWRFVQKQIQHDELLLRKKFGKHAKGLERNSSSCSRKKEQMERRFTWTRADAELAP